MILVILDDEKSMALKGTESGSLELNGIFFAKNFLEANSKTELIYISSAQVDASGVFEMDAQDSSLHPVPRERVADAVRHAAEQIRRMDAGESEEVRIQTFDRFEIFVNGQPMKWSRSKARELMALLVHRAGRKVGKFTLCECLWPDCEPYKALVKLQTTVCSLRKSLACVSREAMSIEYSNDSYRLVLGNVKFDRTQFIHDAESYFKTKLTKWAEDAVSLHGNGYFAEEPWSWALASAEEMHAKHTRLLSGVRAAH